MRRGQKRVNSRVIVGRDGGYRRKRDTSIVVDHVTYKMEDREERSYVRGTPVPKTRPSKYRQKDCGSRQTVCRVVITSRSVTWVFTGTPLKPTFSGPTATQFRGWVGSCLSREPVKVVSINDTPETPDRTGRRGECTDRTPSGTRWNAYPFFQYFVSNFVLSLNQSGGLGLTESTGD